MVLAMTTNIMNVSVHRLYTSKCAATRIQLLEGMDISCAATQQRTGQAGTCAAWCCEGRQGCSQRSRMLNVLKLECLLAYRGTLQCACSLCCCYTEKACADINLCTGACRVMVHGGAATQSRGCGDKGQVRAHAYLNGRCGDEHLDRHPLLLLHREQGAAAVRLLLHLVELRAHVCVFGGWEHSPVVSPASIASS